ncbi:ubiquitin-like domain-containing protein [Streptomyces sp. NPDC048606]|uniref:ubiquitin-like domain-containing protein n=1 Tax=Streptomyces sp. NPDC048606 TaxID=3154726 RepID=UPI00342CF7A6
MSETQGSHRRASWPGTAPDPGPLPHPDGEYGPRSGDGGRPGPLLTPDAPAFDPGLDSAFDPAFDSGLDPAFDAGLDSGFHPDPDPADPDPAPAESAVPAPRGEGRAARRRKAPEPAPRRRRAAPAPTPPPTTAAATAAEAEAAHAAGDGQADVRRPSGRRRAPRPTLGPPDATTDRDPAAPPAPTPAAGTVPGPRSGGRRKRAGRTRTGRPPGAGAGDNWRRLVPQALVVAFLAGGTSAFVAADKAVRLSVDGVPRTLHTFAGSVDELLASEGLGVGPHDLVAPARGSDLDDGEEIVVRYGRPLRLTLDGTSRQVWTTARTVDGALRQLGVRVEGAFLSAPRTAPVPRSGIDLSVRTERGVTFMADGRERTIRTNAATVREALDQAGISLHGEDTTSVAPDSFPRDGQTVTVLRITGAREVREERIPYTTERVEDDTVFAGTEVVERAGRPGARRVTYSLRTVNGVRQQPRKVAEEVVREPVHQLVRVGTKQLPTSVAGADGLDWAALAQCESGGRASATDPSGTYGGLYQFDVATWRSLGGDGRPQDASGSEQTYRAKKLYVQRGASPWPHCGRRLYR